MTECGYYVGDGPTKPSGGMTRTVAADFRKLTPYVCSRALAQAKTVVCEPMSRASIEMPPKPRPGARGSRTVPAASSSRRSSRGDLTIVETRLPAARLHELQNRLPGLTGGEATIEASFGGYAPVPVPPVRRNSGLEVQGACVALNARAGSHFPI